MYSISLLVCFACMYRACRSATYWIKRRLESYRSYRSLKKRDFANSVNSDNASGMCGSWYCHVFLRDCDVEDATLTSLFRSSACAMPPRLRLHLEPACPTHIDHGFCALSMEAPRTPSGMHQVQPHHVVILHPNAACTSRCTQARCLRGTTDELTTAR